MERPALLLGTSKRVDFMRNVLYLLSQPQPAVSSERVSACSQWLHKVCWPWRVVCCLHRDLGWSRKAFGGWEWKFTLFVHCVLSAGQNHPPLHEKHRRGGGSPHRSGMVSPVFCQGMLMDMVPSSWSHCCDPTEEKLFV